MHMTPHPSRLFLIGGGWRPESFSQTYGRFAEAATREGRRKILLVIADEGGTPLEELNAERRGPFKAVGVTDDELATVFVSRKQPLTREVLESVEPTGLFVCGGLTPLYQEALCVDIGWLGYLKATQIPYGGFSAGSSIAADKAVVGGWKIRVDDREIPIVDEEVSEDREFLDVREGLSLVPFSIDVHCSQWGTLSRLLNAVDQGVVSTGWGIDEDTMLQIDRDSLTVHGLGHVHRVRRGGEAGLQVQIFKAGDNPGQ